MSEQYRKHDYYPCLTEREATMSANYFNRVQFALKRVGEPFRFPIPQLSSLDLILQKDAWIVVDRCMRDFPVAVWTDFETLHRDNLHEDIECRLQTYRHHADLFLMHVLEAMEKHLGEELAAVSPATGDKVVPFRSLMRARTSKLVVTHQS